MFAGSTFVYTKYILYTKGFVHMKIRQPRPSWQRVLQGSGWKVTAAPRELGAEYVLARGRQRFLVEEKRAHESRWPLLEGRLAVAALRARAFAQRARGFSPLAILSAPHITDDAGEQLSRFMAEAAPEVAYGLVDDRGRVEFRGGGPEVKVLPTRHTQSAHANRVDIFSDLNQWSLKVLLGDLFPKHLLHTPGGQPFRNASVLASAAQVSLPSITRLLSALESEGFLDRNSGWLRLLRLDELLRRWKAATSRHQREIPVRWFKPTDDTAESLRLAVSVNATVSRASGLSGERIALGLFSAAEDFGGRFVHGAPRHLYAENATAERLTTLGFVPVNDGQPPALIVREPRFPEAVFRATVAPRGAPVTDVLQTWLDVSGHPVRGEEQAAILWRRFIAPAIGAD